MKKIVLIALAVFGVSALVMAQEPTQKKKQEPEKAKKESKKTPEEKVIHAEQKSNGKAFSGNGNGPAKKKAKPQPAKKSPSKVQTQ